MHPEFIPVVAQWLLQAKTQQRIGKLIGCQRTSMQVYHALRSYCGKITAFYHVNAKKISSIVVLKTLNITSTELI
jgi:hypothetical protein